MNQAAAQKILLQLAELGVDTVCICPGARNAPLIQLLSKSQGFKVLSFYDERSAGFFALGRARRDNSPVVVCTTSGTAVSELLSPVIEAYYSNTPLIVLSADRPKRLRGTGAPQAIDQSKIFYGHVEKIWDLSAGDDFKLALSGNKPAHINICFDEPLLGDQISPQRVYSPQKAMSKRQGSEADLLSQLNFKNPLVVIGALSKAQSEALAPELASLDLPIFAEALSGLKNRVALSSQLLHSGEKIVSKMIKSGEVKSVIRLGDVPVGRYWRDLDQLDLPVLNISDKNFPGLERSQNIQHSLEGLSLAALEKFAWDWSSWQDYDRNQADQIHNLITKYPKSEVALVKQMSLAVATGDQVYIGNSLPIRTWDLVSQSQAEQWASRGVNGIDGQLSTAIGLFNEKQRSWALLGDLTTLYDFSGMWLTTELKENKADFNLVVINNKGGQIFSRIFDEPLFRNTHDLEFSKFAAMWGWDYKTITSSGDFPVTHGLNLIEIQPDSQESQQFWQSYDQLWKK